MDINHENSGTNGRFYYKVKGKEVATMTYSRTSNDVISIDHTEVDEALKGEGVGYKLVDASVEYARTHNLKIKPLCSFVASVF